MENADEVLHSLCVGMLVGCFLQNTSRVLEGIELYKECVILLNKKVLQKENKIVKSLYIGIYLHMLRGYCLIYDQTSAIECGKKLLVLLHGCGLRGLEGSVAMTMATLYKNQSEYMKAEELYGQALEVMMEIGDRKGESTGYGNLGIVFHCLGKYVKAEECLRKALQIKKEIGDRQSEASCCGSLGSVFLSLGEYFKAKEYFQKALKINEDIGDIQGQAFDYGKLGILFQSLGEYDQAEEYLQKALEIRKRIGDRQGEASDYGNLGTVFYSQGKYLKAEKYLQKALAIAKEIGDRQGEASDYGNLGTVFRSLGEYVNAEEYFQKALAIRKEIGDTEGEAIDYGNLGIMFRSLGEYVKAEEYLQKALVIGKEIGARQTIATSYGNLGVVFLSRGDYIKAEEYLQKSLVIRKEIGDIQGEARDYGNLATVFLSLGEPVKAEEYLRKALAMTKTNGDRRGEALFYGNLGALFHSLDEYAKSKEYDDKALALIKEIGDAQAEFIMYSNLALDFLSVGNTLEALSNLFSSIRKCEEMRRFLRDNDQFKISFLDVQIYPYRFLSALFCRTGNPAKALYAVELGRARALADLMAAHYSVGEQISSNPQSWDGIERIIKKESNCICLYISYFDQYLFLWILKASQPILFRRIDASEHSVNQRSVKNLDEFFGKEPFRKFQVLPQEHCEDRSLFPSNASHMTGQSQGDSLAGFRLVEEEDDDDNEPQPSLALYYKLLIAPVADLLDEPEIVIVPDRSLYRVPFAALKDGNEKYLSEIFRIRIVPSLMTLKLIQDRPAYNRSTNETDALIVGDPAVSHVMYLNQLPCARKEAEMIGELFGVQPLLGHQATKPVVLDMMHSASLIHVAAHGDAQRGEIALAPERPTNRILQEDDYLLTMSDISQVQLRAELVVLSCCHSGRGQIRAEGVIGIARAFLGSGARSVLVSLWAIQDKATEQFMRRFYEHLVRGESASESLHQAMKWMRGNGFSDVRQWAPFMLIGDNVTFDFGK